MASTSTDKHWQACAVRIICENDNIRATLLAELLDAELGCCQIFKMKRNTSGVLPNYCYSGSPGARYWIRDCLATSANTMGSQFGKYTILTVICKKSSEVSGLGFEFQVKQYCLYFYEKCQYFFWIIFALWYDMFDIQIEVNGWILKNHWI